MAIGPWDGDVAGLSGMMDEELAETGGKLVKKRTIALCITLLMLFFS